MQSGLEPAFTAKGAAILERVIECDSHRLRIVRSKTETVLRNSQRVANCPQLNRVS
jgi:hypothetical protein